MPSLFQPLSSQVAIVDEEGRPTAEFARLLQKLGLAAELKLNADGTIGIADDSITEAMIQDDAVTLPKIEDISDDRVLGNNNGSAASPEELTASEVLDMIGATHGDILYRDSADWQVLAPGTAGQVLQTNGSGADPSWVTSSSAGAWALAGTSWAATGVYDQAVDGAQANVSFLDLAGKTDIMVIMAATTLSVSGQEQLQVSTNNGSTWFTTSGDYISIDSAGVTTNTPGSRFVDTNHTAARHSTQIIWGANVTGIPKPMDLVPRGSGGKLVHFIASTSPINAVRVNGSNGGNVNGGKIYCLAR